jgi:hypothetical protein
MLSLIIRYKGHSLRLVVSVKLTDVLPETPCMECQRPAAWLCLECVYDLAKPGLLCDKHNEAHPHTDYGEPVPLVNSPRVGMCGYEGPAEPPY